jgi:hypothetical protein
VIRITTGSQALDELLGGNLSYLDSLRIVCAANVYAFT